ncbi:MAG TPA: membrane dipeptidase [Bryobacteraceae bacterium]|nr:membrane dipeptidase [Bryobacteraceae bacterium]
MPTRRTFLKSALAAPFLNLNRYTLFAQTAPYSARAVTLVRESVVIDMLNQFLYRRDMQAKLRQWFSKPGAFTEADFKPFHDSGLTAASFGEAADNYDAGIKLFADWNSFLAMYPDRLLRISTAADFARAKNSGRYGILFGLQNSTHFRKPDDVDVFYGLGQRSGQLTYNYGNLLGAGAFERTNAGVTEFGARILERMNRAGMAVDCGHAGERTMLDAFELSKRPVIISHGNCRALYPGYTRNVTDEAIKAMAKTGGVMGINFISSMVKAHEPTTVDDVVDHFDHVSKLAGVEHVGVGSDMGIESNDFMPPGELARMLASMDARYHAHHREAVEHLDHPKRIYDLTDALIRRGYTDEHIRLILGENWRRVLTEIWTVA